MWVNSVKYVGAVCVVVLLFSGVDGLVFTSKIRMRRLGRGWLQDLNVVQVVAYCVAFEVSPVDCDQGFVGQPLGVRVS